MTKKLNIAITLRAEEDNAPSVWSSGAWQNIIFLYYLLKESNIVDNVRLYNSALKPAKTLEIIKGTILPLHTYDELKDDTDVLIIMGIQLGKEITDSFKVKGTKIVPFYVGNHYVITLETILFDLTTRGGGDFDGTVADAVWTIPQHYHTCASFFEVTARAPVSSLPHLWNPLFVDYMIRSNNLGDKFGYKYKKQHYTESNGKQKIAIFEPNINIVKSSIYPMLISELAYRNRPDLISSIHVTNTAKLHKQAAFNNFAHTLDITTKAIASYDDRYDTPSFMSFYGDIVLTHQWENGLNYLYYDVLYGKYPLVHNSVFLKDVGYYYEDFNATQGAERLIESMTNHDEEKYAIQCAKELEKVDIYNPANIKAYDDALMALF
jgi:Protein of unknown function (DUF2827)